MSVDVYFYAESSVFVWSMKAHIHWIISLLKKLSLISGNNVKIMNLVSNIIRVNEYFLNKWNKRILTKGLKESAGLGIILYMQHIIFGEQLSKAWWVGVLFLVTSSSSPS